VGVGAPATTAESRGMHLIDVDVPSQQVLLGRDLQRLLA
jgi:hypothetical protein